MGKDEIAGLDGMPAVVACPGKLLIRNVWFIPESLRTTRMQFEYTLSNNVVYTGYYPSPGRTRFVIHRMQSEIPDVVAANRQVSAGDQTLAVRISDTRTGRVLLASELASFRYARAADLDTPAIPQVISPPDQTELDGDTRFQWASASPVQFYELSLTNPDGVSGIFITSRTDMNVYFNAADHTPMPPGVYSWGIRAVNTSGVGSGFSEWRSFIVR